MSFLILTGVWDLSLSSGFNVMIVYERVSIFLQISLTKNLM